MTIDKAVALADRATRMRHKRHYIIYHPGINTWFVYEKGRVKEALEKIKGRGIS